MGGAGAGGGGLIYLNGSAVAVFLSFPSRLLLYLPLSQVSSYKTLHIYSPKANYQPPVSCDYLSFSQRH